MKHLEEKLFDEKVAFSKEIKGENQGFSSISLEKFNSMADYNSIKDL